MSETPILGENKKLDLEESDYNLEEQENPILEDWENTPLGNLVTKKPRPRESGSSSRSSKNSSSNKRKKKRQKKKRTFT